MTKEKSWELLRWCIKYLKENDPEWCEGRLKSEKRKMEVDKLLEKEKRVKVIGEKKEAFKKK